MASTMNCGLGTLHSAYSRRHNGEHIHSPISKLLVSELHGRSKLLRVSCKSRSVDGLGLNKTENQSDDAVLNQWTCERKPTSDNVKADKKPTFNPFKKIKSTEDWMKFVSVLHVGSSLMINQLLLDKRVQLVGVLKVGKTTLLNSAWFTKNVSALVLIALALKLVMDGKVFGF